MAEERGSTRVALVTGAARGLGASIARALGNRGFAVAVNSRPGGTDPTGTTRAIEAAGGHALAFPCDCFDPASARRLVAEIEHRLGRLDVLVLSATPAIAATPFAQSTDDQLGHYLDAYLRGPFALVQAALPGMTRRKEGRIIAILTSAISELPPRQAAYVAAKAGLRGLCRALAVELGSVGITVNTVSPGALQSDDQDPVTKARESIAARSYPLRRLGTHGDVADVVAFLASADTGYVSGSDVAVTGGRPL